MDMDTKKLKWISILLLVVEIIILPNSAFCKFSEKAAGEIGTLLELAGFFYNKMPDSAMHIIIVISKGKLTLPQLFKMYIAYFETTGADFRDPIYLVVIAARILLVCLWVVLVIKVILHLLDRKSYEWFVNIEKMVMIYAIIELVIVQLVAIVELELDFWSVRITVLGILMLVLPFVSEHLWNKYYSTIQEGKSTENVRSTKKICPQCEKEQDVKNSFCMKCGFEFTQDNVEK